jgi:hypothetical protein
MGLLYRQGEGERVGEQAADEHAADDFRRTQLPSAPLATAPAPSPAGSPVLNRFSAGLG